MRNTGSPSGSSSSTSAVPISIGTHSSTSPTDTGIDAVIAHISHLDLSQLDQILRKGEAYSPANARLSDDELALVLFAEEAEGLLRRAKDRLLDTHTASHEASDIFDELLAMEEMAEYDHAVALALSEDRVPPPRPQPRARRSTAQQGASSIMRSLTPPRPWSPEHEELEDSDSGRRTTEDKQLDGLPARSRTQLSLGLIPLSREPTPRIPKGFDPVALLWPVPSVPPTLESLVPRGHMPALDPRRHREIPARKAPPPLRPREPVPICTICREEIAETIIYTRCGHFLDVACLRTLFEKAIGDEALYPPKCCQDPLDFDTLGEYLTSAIRDQYRRKTREYRTKDRVYCHDPACSSFLSGATAAPTCIRCTDCGSVTCGCCKAQAHRGRACVESLSDEGMLDFAREQGWQRCPSCHHLVERDEGCYHMTCRCQQEFCYLCAAAWKTCACPRFPDIPDE